METTHRFDVGTAVRRVVPGQTTVIAKQLACGIIRSPERFVPNSGKGEEMYTRLFYGTIQTGKEKEALEVLNEFVPRVKQQRGCILNQVLQSGSEIVGITTWATKEDLAAYADGDLAKELFTRIMPLFMGRPTVRSYEVRVNLWDQAAAKSI